MELQIQKFMRSGKTFEELKESYGISVTEHPEFPIVIFNYSQIDSPKMEKIVHECRGLVLEWGTWNIVARSFERFFNLGEASELQESFNWNNFSTTSKEDGSVFMMFHYAGQWLVKTRNSWANGFVNEELGLTWVQLFEQATHGMLAKLNSGIPGLGFFPNHTYTVEIASPYNKIVRMYPQPVAYLLAVHTHGCGFEYDNVAMDRLTELTEAGALRRPEVYRFRSLAEVEAFIKMKEETEPTFEGVVVRDNNNNRIKIKSSSYISLHHLRGEGESLFKAKNHVPLILAGETEELLSYFPEAKEFHLGVKPRWNRLFRNC